MIGVAATERLLTPAEVAVRMSVSRDTVRCWIASGQLAAVRVNAQRRGRHGHYRVASADLETFVAGRRTATRIVRPAAGRRQSYRRIV